MKTTLITGASSGIGEAFARALAARGESLLLVARSEERLVSLCNELGREHGVNCQHFAVDLTEGGACGRLFEETKARGLEVETLVNNAGFGSMGEFTSLELARELNMIELNVRALVELTHLFLKPMRERGRGAIINVASTAAFQPVPYMATYAATKAFVLSFSEALWEENRGRGVKVLALCPGVTETNFFAAAHIGRPPHRTVETPDEVVTTALRALARGRSHVVSGWLNYALAESQRLVPRSLVARVLGRALSKQRSEVGG
ncbi:MAG: SDR family oxidoreductase [Acidobacteria bacterium]|nr:SDR family oxidoreductase [Acidobacteriota bacterium]